jgi:hypothetical protein
MSNIPRGRQRAAMIKYGKGRPVFGYARTSQALNLDEVTMDCPLSGLRRSAHCRAKRKWKAGAC